MTVSAPFVWFSSVINASCTDNMFHFTCFNVEDPSDPSVGLIDGQLSIPGNLLREKVFDPVVSQVSLSTFFLSSIPSHSALRHRFSL